jgi:chemotaxis protein histidine kinase CheA
MGAGDFLNNALGSTQKDAQNGLKNASNALASGGKSAQQIEQQAQQKAQQAEQEAAAAEKKAQQEVQQAQQKVQQAEQKLADAEKQAQQQLANAEKQAQQALAGAEAQAQQLEKSAENAANQAVQQAQQELQQAKQQLANAEKQAQQALADAKKLAQQELANLEQKGQQLENTLKNAVNDKIKLLQNNIQALKNAAMQAIQQRIGKDNLDAISKLASDPQARAQALSTLSQVPKFAAAQAASLVYAKAAASFPNTPLDMTEQPCALASKYSKALQGTINNSETLLNQVPPALQNAPAVKSLANLVNADKMALMARDVYGDGPPIQIPGFHTPTPDELDSLGLSPSDFSLSSPDFKSQLYISNGQPPVYTLAFRGTDNLSNVITDVQNALGIPSDAYKKAIDLAGMLQLAAQAKGAALQLTGHSLGGGLAQAAASNLLAGGKAVTGAIFNAAGYNPASTLPAAVADTEKALTNYHVLGEPVTTFQNAVQGVLPAAAQSVPIPGPLFTGLGGMHSMNSVVGGMNKTTQEAEKNVQKLLGGK